MGDSTMALSFTEESQHSLTQQVIKEEVYVVNQMHHFKAPDSDGFLGIFFKQFWHIVRDDVVQLISDAFVISSFHSCLSETLIALIHKVDCHQNFK